MKKGKYQAPEMEVVKLNSKSTMLVTSTCPTECDSDGEIVGGGGGGF